MGTEQIDRREVNDDDHSNCNCCDCCWYLLDLASQYEHQSRSKTDYRTAGRVSKEARQELSTAKNENRHGRST